MIRRLLIFVVFFVSSLWGQFVTITGNVTDPVSGEPYQNAVGRATLISGNGQTSAWTIGGVNPVRTPIITNLDGFGNFTVSLTNTCLIDQQTAQPVWQFSWTSAEYANVGTVSFTGPTLALCSDQNITQQITNVPPAPLPIFPGGGGGGGGGVGEFIISFTNATTVSVLGLTHRLNVKGIDVTCFDNAAPANYFEPGSYTVNSTTFDVLINFATPKTGYCALIAGGQAGGGGGGGNSVIDVTTFPGSDMCYKINNAMIANPGRVLDARAFIGNQSCGVNPFTNSAGDVMLLLGDVTVQTVAPWVTNSRFSTRVVGTTRSNLVAGQASGTRIQAVTGFPATCDGLSIGCPIFREGDFSGGSNGAFNHMIEHITLDCNNTGTGTAVSGIGLYSNDIQEQSGAMFFEIDNCPLYGVYIDGSAGPAGKSAENFVLEHGEVYPFSSSTTSTVGIGIIGYTPVATNARILSDITVASSNTVHGAAGFQFQNTNNGVLQGLNSEQFVTGYDIGPNSKPVNGIALVGVTCGLGTTQCVWIHSGSLNADLSTVENGSGNTTIKDDTAFPSGVVITDFLMAHYTTADSGAFRFNTSHYTANSGNGNLLTSMFVRDTGGLSGFASFTEASDKPAIITFNSGLTAAQGQNLQFLDRGSLKWTIQNTGVVGGAGNSNAFQVLDQNSSVPRLFFSNTAVNTGYSALNSAGSGTVFINDDSNSGTGGLQVCSGGPTPICNFQVNSSGTITSGSATGLTMTITIGGNCSLVITGGIVTGHSGAGCP